jgi:hypothetical protein
MRRFKVVIVDISGIPLFDESFPQFFSKTMKPADQYHRLVRWPDEDQIDIGYRPDL